VTFYLHIAIWRAGLRQAAELHGLLAENFNAFRSTAGASGNFNSCFYDVPASLQTAIAGRCQRVFHKHLKS
jgi:hypothetical protein